MPEISQNAIKATNGTGTAISLTSASNTCTANITNNLSNRNLIINGAMNIWQRGDGPYTIAYAYSADRWERNFTLSGSDYYHIEKKTESPPGFASSLEVSFGTVQSSVAANQYALLRQKIEAQNLQQLAYGTSSAKKMTLSFWVRSNKTGTYAVTFNQSDNSSKQTSFNYSISSADTWEKKTISIPADTSGVINNDSGIGLMVTWWLVAGSNATSGTLRNTAWTTYAEADQAVGHNVNVADSTSNTWYITGVQLEVSDYATDFEHRSYGDELAKCQRYFTRRGYGTQYTYVASGIMASSTQPRCHIELPTTMRAAPTITEVGSLIVDSETASGQEVTSITSSDASIDGGRVQFACNTHAAGGGQSIQIYTDTATSGLDFSAEL